MSVDMGQYEEWHGTFRTGQPREYMVLVRVWKITVSATWGIERCRDCKRELVREEEAYSIAGHTVCPECWKRMALKPASKQTPLYGEFHRMETFTTEPVKHPRARPRRRRLGA